MRNLSALSVLLTSALILTGCAKTDGQVIEASCNSAEENKAFCRCFTEKMAAVLPEETFARIADTIRDGAKTPQDAISKLSAADQLKTLAVVPQLFSCPAE